MSQAVGRIVNKIVSAFSGTSIPKRNPCFEENEAGKEGGRGRRKGVGAAFSGQFIFLARKALARSFCNARKMFFKNQL